MPANVATPATAAFGFAVHDSVAPAGVVRSSVTLLVSATIRCPFVSSTVTTGCAANALPPDAEALGCVVKASFAAGPVMSKLGLTAVVSEPSVAVRV